MGHKVALKSVRLVTNIATQIVQNLN
uniref:Uncharacterized protein n=1 Tax=Arundo donax TaxID=35708 RepID=A0A0A8ZRV1_ARUDO